MTSEKIAPSPLDMVADLGKALVLERKMSTRGAKMPLKDALNRVIADYNKLVTLKRHRVDSSRRAMCYNLFLIVISSLRSFFDGTLHLLR